MFLLACAGSADPVQQSPTELVFVREGLLVDAPV